MDTLAFDGQTGAAGDMICAALIAAGADPAVLEPIEAALPVRFVVDETTKNGIRATTVDVLLTDASADYGDGADTDIAPDADCESADCGHTHDHDHDHDHDHTHDHDHDHKHTHDHDHDHKHTHDHDHDHKHTHDHDHKHDHTHDHDHKHDHTHDHDHDHTHAEDGGTHRTYPEVVSLVESMALPADVEANALAAFELLGTAEAAVHGTDLAATQFHEVGADDAIADIVGACLLRADLDVDRVLTGPIATGGGTVRMSHGIYPVPAPAVVEVADRAGLALSGGPVDAELLTPTGAAIIGALADPVDSLPALSVDTVGYGSGTASFPDYPNVLRAIGGTVIDDPADRGEHGAGNTHDRGSHTESTHDSRLTHDSRHTHDSQLTHDAVTVLETTVDDVSPEVLGGLQASLADAGARDVTIVPTTMKKSRPGHLVTVICPPADADAVAERLARETGTLGVRETSATHRWIADRSFQSVTIDIGDTTHDVTVKRGATATGEVYDISAEYDDAAAVAAATDLPIREVMHRAETAARAADDGMDLDLDRDG